MKEIIDFFKPVFKQPWYIILGSLVGAFGILNVMDSSMLAILKHPWSLIPSSLRDVFELFRAVIHPVYDFIFGWLNINLPGVCRDYFTMGLIVMFMRLRSTSVIAKTIKKGNMPKYEEKVLNRTIIVKKTSSRFTWFLFYSYRLIYAFLLWPLKLGGAILRYVTGKKRPVAEGQYMVFFMSVLFAVFIIFLLVICKASGCY